MQSPSIFQAYLKLKIEKKNGGKGLFTPPNFLPCHLCGVPSGTSTDKREILEKYLGHLPVEIHSG